MTYWKDLEWNVKAYGKDLVALRAANWKDLERNANGISKES
jgi:hypothetical protein